MSGAHSLLDALPHTSPSPSRPDDWGSHPCYHGRPVKTALRIIGSALLCACLFTAPTGHAQTPASGDEARLVQLYDAYLTKGKSDAYLEKRIEEELRKIRKAIDAELKQSVATQTAEDAADPAALPRALDRQRGVVDSLEQSVSEHKVDLDLLEEEERKYYLNTAAGTGTSLDDLRITASYAELLAKKAILEQRIAAYDSVLSLQRDRLDKLANEQRFQQFGTFFDILWYAVIILLAIAADRLLKRMFVGRIEKNQQRYLASKALTGVVYGIALLWIVSRLLEEHPGAFASLAIVGAGIAVALQSVVKDIFGWLMIIQRRYYAPGDRISIGGFTGDVIDIGPLRTAMLEVSSTQYPSAPERGGKMLYFPNSLVLSSEVLNFHTTSDYVTAELKVTVTHDSDWRRAETLLKELVTEETKEFAATARTQQQKRTALFYLSRKVGEPEVHLDAVENGYQFTLGFTVPIGFRRDVVTRMWHKLLDRFRDAGNIHIAFNTLKLIDERPKQPSSPQLPQA